MNTNISRLSSVLTAVFALGCWEVAHRAGAISGRLPSLLAVCSAFFSHAFLAELLPAVSRTVYLTGLALILGTSIGYVFGLFVGLVRPYLDGPYHLANALKSTPVTVLIPFFLGVFGLQRFLLPLLALPVTAIMTANVADAVYNTSRKRRGLLRIRKVPTRFYIQHVLNFELLEPLFASLRVVVPLALAIEVAIDYFLNINGGIGALISRTYQMPNREGEMYAAICLVAVGGVATVFFIDKLARRGLRWKRDM